ncbi:malate dehydrogenase (quinone) [Paracidovorax citrulli]|nr:malate dehydrogenase (quinone) [Paracidovorax citrulli]
MKKTFKALSGTLLVLVLAAVLFLYWPLFPRSVPLPKTTSPSMW